MGGARNYWEDLGWNMKFFSIILFIFFQVHELILSSKNPLNYPELPLNFPLVLYFSYSYIHILHKNKLHTRNYVYSHSSTHIPLKKRKERRSRTRLYGNIEKPIELPCKVFIQSPYMNLPYIHRIKEYIIS